MLCQWELFRQMNQSKVILKIFAIKPWVNGDVFGKSVNMLLWFNLLLGIPFTTSNFNLSVVNNVTIKENEIT